MKTEKDQEKDETKPEDAKPTKAIAKAQNERMDGLVTAALSKVGEGPRVLQEVQFGKDNKGYGADAVAGPVIRELAKSCNCGDCGPNGALPKLRAKIEAWQPGTDELKFIRRILYSSIDSLSDRMSHVGAEVLEDELLCKSPEA